MRLTIIFISSLFCAAALWAQAKPAAKPVAPAKPAAIKPAPAKPAAPVAPVTKQPIEVKPAETTAPPVAAAPASPATAEATPETKSDDKAQKTLPNVRVIGEDESFENVPGSGQALEKKDLESARVFTTSEALRKVSGVNVRDEEGFSLRPNIGIRGLNPTRSTKVLLLEDGIPLGYAPYGDNASYYHPPIERFERVEVLKGAGQLRYGPQTVGGVINYITKNPPKDPSGSVTLTGGNRDYWNGNVSYGGFWGNAGFMVDYTRKQGQGARDNTNHKINDLNLKSVLLLNNKHTLTTRGNVYTEDSQVTYSGLTQAEYDAAPRQNLFSNDYMQAKRLGSSVTHTWALNGTSELTTNLYGAYFSRDWWRQSSNSAQRPNDSSDAVRCSSMANLHTTCGNEGRLRSYYTAGIEPKLKLGYTFMGEKQELNTGVRAHFEIQDRKQMNGDFPLSRSAGSSTNTNAGLVENNERSVDAYSGFMDHVFKYKMVSFTPGVRVEHMRLARTNRLASVGNVDNRGIGIQGNQNLTEIIPGAGVNVTPFEKTTFFAGVHKGFSPPRVEDALNNTTGLAVDLAPERSINYEAGARTKIIPGIGAEATYFRMDFSNQIVASSVAGGTGAVLTNGGQTLQQGGELDLKFGAGEFFKTKHNIYFVSAYTWLPTARFEGTRLSGTTSVSGNRVPYTPEHMLTSSIGYSHPIGIDVRFEQVYVATMLADELNTESPTANGQAGRIPEYLIYNASVNYTYEPWGTTVFFTAKNITDKVYIADRTRGVLPGTPRLFQFGVQVRF